MVWTQKRKDAQKLFKLNEKALRDAKLISGSKGVKIKNTTGDVIIDRNIDRRSAEYKNVINRYSQELIDRQKLFKLKEKALKDSGFLTGKKSIKIKNTSGNVIFERDMDRRSVEYKNVINKYSQDLISKQKRFKLNEKALKDNGLLSDTKWVKIKNTSGNVVFENKVDKRSSGYKDVINRYADEFVPSSTTTTSNGFLLDNEDIYGKRFIANLLRPYLGQSINLEFNGLSYPLEVPLNVSRFEQDIQNMFQVESPDNVFSKYARENNTNVMPPIKISRAIDITRHRLKQSFLDAKIHHCLFEPIKQFYLKQLEDCDKVKNKSKIKKINAIVNHCKKQEVLYPDGVPEDKLKDVVETIGVGGIDICFPFQQTGKYISVRHSYKNQKIFNFVNTRKNHLEHSDLSSKDDDLSGLFSNDNVIELADLDEMYKIKMELDEKNEFYLYKKTKDINTIYTLHAKYKLVNEYKKLVEEFESENNIDSFKICDIADKELSEFVTDSVHINGIVDFNDKTWNMESIDQEKAYYNYHKCKYLNGVLGKITDFRQVSVMIKDENNLSIPAIYKVRNFNFSKVDKNKLKILNKLNCYHDYNVYPSVELDFLSAHGVTFDVIEGCWGARTLDTKLEIIFPESFIPKDEHKVRMYSRYVGNCNSHFLNEKVFLKGDKEYFENIACFTDVKNSSYHYYEDRKEGYVRYNKKSNRHFAHFAAFVTSCQRINCIEQLFNFDFDNIIRVVTDEIYFVGDRPKIMEGFRTKDDWRNKGWQSAQKIYCTGISIIKEGSDELVHWLPKFRENFCCELHIGPGGTGKTHYNLLDKGFVRPVYMAPSWKLCASKQEEYKIDAYPWSYLLDGGESMTKYSAKIIRNYNVLIVDEVSMMSEEQLGLFRDRAIDFGMKILCMGDIGYQLSCIQKNGQKATPVTKDSFIQYLDIPELTYTIKEYTKTFRFQCSRLENILNNIREKIDNHLGGSQILEYVLNSCKDRIIESEEGIYNINDYILTYTNDTKNKYNKYKGKFGELEKVRFTKRYDTYFNGTIKVLDKKTLSSLKYFEIQHGFTTHCIQGETIPVENKIFIDIERFQTDPKLIYTAMSRAKTLEQIYFIKSL